MALEELINLIGDELWMIIRYREKDVAKVKDKREWVARGYNGAFGKGNTLEEALEALWDKLNGKVGGNKSEKLCLKK